MHFFRGSWNTTDEEVPMHSPVRLLQKLSAYRASTASTPVSSSPSPSPQNERKSTILTESTNFFTRLWRSNNPNISPSALLAASHQTNSSSFDQIPEPTPVVNDTSTSQTMAPKSSRRISLIREVSSKNPPSLPTFGVPLALPPLLQTQPTTSSTVTDPSFEDTTSEQPGDTTSEFYSQSFETNPDGGLIERTDEQTPYLTYDLRHHRISVSAKSVIPTAKSIRIQDSYHSDSLASPDANIDVSMVSSVMPFFSLT